MAKEFRLPDIGEGLTEAEIVRWLVAEGERVEADQPVVEVETDKAVVEIPSPYAGIVLKHGGAEGETLAVGSVLVVIGEPGESTTATAAPGPGRAAFRGVGRPDRGDSQRGCRGSELSSGRGARTRNRSRPFRSCARWRGRWVSI